MFEEDLEDSYASFPNNRVSDFSPNIFLNRNLNRMKTARKQGHKTTFVKGLVHRLLPLVN